MTPTPPSTDPPPCPSCCGTAYTGCPLCKGSGKEPQAKIGAPLGEGAFAVERTGVPSTDPPDIEELERLADEADGCTFVFQKSSRSDRYLEKLAKAGHWLIAQAREMAAIRAEVQNPSGVIGKELGFASHAYLQLVFARALRVGALEDELAELTAAAEAECDDTEADMLEAHRQLTALESVLRPLVADPTPEKVVAEVAHVMSLVNDVRRNGSPQDYYESHGDWIEADAKRRGWDPDAEEFYDWRERMAADAARKDP